MFDINQINDTIDLRDVMARVEELREARDESGESVDHWAIENADDAEELQKLEALLAECKGNGGDEQWEGDWYPVTLIRDGYFEDYAQELAEDLGAVNADASWPNNCIDWERAAHELQQDYTTIEFEGETYWTR